MDLLLQIRERITEGSLSTGENELLGYKRPSPGEARQISPAPKESAVLFPIYLRNSEWYTAFIQRPTGIGVHSGQLSFPGGKIETGETTIGAALRETEEEIGVHAASIKIECRLSEIYIPPSNFIVQPFIGQLHENPVFTTNQAEVDRIIEYPVFEFLQEGIVVQKEVFVPLYQKKMSVRCFEVNGLILWGATAMMVQEFRSALGFRS